MEMLGEWREEDALKEDNINIDELLQTTAGQTRAANLSVQSQAPSLSTSAEGLLMSQSDPQDYHMSHQKVPTFSSSANRPSVLDLSTTAIKSEYGEGGQRMNMNGHNPHQRDTSPHHNLSPHSPHQRSPYVSNQQVFNYSNTGQSEQQSPMSPHAPQQVYKLTVFI